MKRKEYNRENCSNRIRMSVKDCLGRTIVLTGRHAFEWKITIITPNSTTTIQFKGRVEATKEFNKYKRIGK